MSPPPFRIFKSFPCVPCPVISVRDDVLEWLMDGPSWVSFAVETQLLGRRSDPSLAWDNKEIGDVIERLRDERSGFPALRTGKLSYISGGNVYWTCTSYRYAD